MEPNTYLTKEQFDQWIVALESGKYNKGAFALKSRDCGGAAYCCLGVAQEIFDIKVSNSAFLLTYNTVGEDYYLLDNSLQSSIAAVNDRSDSFEPVATVLREWVEQGLIKFGEKFA